MKATIKSSIPTVRSFAWLTATVWLAAALWPVQNLSALTVTAVTSDNGYPAHQVQWTDSAGLPRTAVLVDQNSLSVPYTGYLRRYSYQVNGQTRTCTGTQNYRTGGNLEFSGDGFVQNHTGASDTYPDGGDFSSGNGGGVPGTTTITLQGADHAIIAFSMPNYQIVNQAGQSQTVPTTVQWFFADGRSHPVFAISQDARATSGNLAADSRSPYGDMAYDGDGTGAYVGGCSYGDTYKFVTLAANPEEVTEASGWRDTEANTIPYAMQWANPATVDAEMGHVATLPISVSDQGEDAQDYPVVDGRGTSQINGPMLTDESWAFQILNDSFPASGPTTTKRLTWGANYGRVGGWDDSSPGYTDPRYPDNLSASLTQYNKHYDDPVGDIQSGTRVSGLLMAYSVFIVFGTHTGGYTNGTVGQEVIQMQNAPRATLAATVGTVAASGPAGVGNAGNAAISYTPVGYDPTYATWEISALTNTVNATLTPAAGAPLDHPIFVINNYTAVQLPPSIAVGSGLTNAGVNYFASVDTNGQRLWITVNRVVTNTLNLVINVSGGGSAAPMPVISSFPASGTVGAAIVIMGQNFTGATAVVFHGVSAGFTVNSATQITATVPVGATAGVITVTTPGGTATSATSFTPLPAPASLVIYSDTLGLVNGFQDYSWATVNDSATSPVYSGTYSIEVSGAAYYALSLYNPAGFSTVPYAWLNFWINGGSAGASGIQVMGVVGTNYLSIYDLPVLAANTWQQFTLPLSALGAAAITNCNGFWFWPTTAGTTTFYVDAVQLVSATPPVLSTLSPQPVSKMFVLQLSGQSGLTYWLETSTNLANWTIVSTNLAASSTLDLTNPLIPGARSQFWRALAH